MSSRSDLPEYNETPDQPRTPTGIDAAKFEEVLHSTLNVATVIDDFNVFELLGMNDFLVSRCNDSTKRCLEYLKTRSQEPIPMPNALNLLRLAHSMEENVLVDTLNAHICGHVHHFSKDARLMGFSFESLKALLAYGRDYILPLPGSSDVPLAIIHNWVNCNRVERSQYRGELLKRIDSSKVSSDFALSLITRLENAVDEMELSTGVQSTKELKTLKTRIDLGDIAGNAQLDGRISLKVKNIGADSFPDESSSPCCTISNLSWIVCAEKRDDEVSVGLQCDCSDSTLEWNCYASAVFTIKSHKKGKEDYESKTAHGLFSSNTRNSVGCVENLKLEYLINPENGFLEDGQSITFYASVQVDVPFRPMISIKKKKKKKKKIDLE